MRSGAFPVTTHPALCVLGPLVVPVKVPPAAGITVAPQLPASVVEVVELVDVVVATVRVVVVVEVTRVVVVVVETSVVVVVGGGSPAGSSSSFERPLSAPVVA